MKFITLDIFEYIPSKTRIFLNSDFKLRLINEAMKKAKNGIKNSRKGRKKLAIILGVCEQKIYDWKTKGRRPMLHEILKLGKIAEIDKQEILGNISEITAYQTAGRIRIKDWKMNFDEEFAEWLGLLKGDGCIQKYDIRFCNNNLDLIFFFTEFVERNFGFNRKRMEVTIRKPTHENQKEIDKIIKILKLNGFVRIKFEEEAKRKFARKENNLSVRISSRILVEFVISLISGLLKLLNESSKPVKIGYIRGFAAAEGTISFSRGQRAVSFSQKNIKELELIERILKVIGIHNIRCYKSRDMNQMTITTRREIEKYRNLIGFGHHNIKNNKLDRIISGYVQSLPYKTSKAERYESVLKAIEKLKQPTCKNISNKLNLKEKYINSLLKDMLNRNLICVSKYNKKYSYFINQSSLT